MVPYHTSECLTGGGEGGEVVSWAGLTWVSLPVQGLQAPDIVLEHLLGPPGVSHGLP